MAVTIPDSVPTRVVHIKIVTESGGGTLEFPCPALYDASGQLILAATTFTATLSGGEASITLPRCDVDTITPLDWSYQVRLKVLGMPERLVLQVVDGVGAQEFASTVQPGAAPTPAATYATQAALTAEAATRADADTALSTSLTAEVSRATAAEAAAVATAAADATTKATAAEAAAIAASQPLDADLSTIAALDSSQSGVVASDGTGWFRKTYAALKTALGLVKGDVGLGNVDNTSDADKPVSTATQAALDLKAADSAVVHKTGTETVAGNKTFTGTTTTVRRLDVLPTSPADGTVLGTWNPSGNTWAILQSGSSGDVALVSQLDDKTFYIKDLAGAIVAAFTTAATAATASTTLNGEAIIGGKASLNQVRFPGANSTTGAPTSGTHVAGEIVPDSAGAWWLCTVGGTPGTWVTGMVFGSVTAQTSYGASSSDGAATTVAHSDHTHGTPSLSSSAASTSAVGDAASAGSGSTAAKSDHVHGREAFGAVTAQTSFGASSGNGAAATPSRSDHVHGTPTHDGTAHSAVSISSLAAPTGSVAWGSQKITSLANGSSAQDAAAFGQIIPASLVDAKGDLIVATADNTVARQAVGSNGRVLAADSTQTNGVRYATVSGQCPLVAGRWYVPSTGGTSSSIPGEANERAIPLLVGRSCTLTGIACSVTVVGTAGAVVRLGIREDSSGLPGNVLYDSGTIDAVSSTGVKQANPGLAVTEGQVIWVSVVVQGGAGTRPTLQNSVNVHEPMIGDTSVSALLGTVAGAYQASSISGALPNSASWSVAATVFRVAVTAAA